MNYVLTFTVALVLFVFVTIHKNSTDYEVRKQEFKIKCENKGGIVFSPSGVKGWPALECRNPKAMINID